LAIAIALALGSTGCSALAGLEAGPTYALAKAPESAAAINGYVGLGLGDASFALGAGSELRGKIGPKMGQVALGPMAYGLFGGSVVLGYVRAGFDLVSFESVYERFAFGMFSPRLGLGTIFRFGRGEETLGISVMLEGEYVVRFTETPNTGYAALMIGLVGVKASSLRTAFR
jgi:hypothetical protein